MKSQNAKARRREGAKARRREGATTRVLVMGAHRCRLIDALHRNLS
jgi:hypothetical protein